MIPRIKALPPVGRGPSASGRLARIGEQVDILKDILGNLDVGRGLYVTQDAHGRIRIELANGTGNGGQTWNGYVYDFYGNQLYSCPRNQDGSLAVTGTHVKITPSLSGENVTFSVSQVSDASGSDAIYYKVAECVNNKYTLTADQIGAIRLPFPATGAKKFQVYSFGENGLPGFDWVRAHVGQEPQQQSGGGEGEGGGG